MRKKIPRSNLSASWPVTQPLSSCSYKQGPKPFASKGSRGRSWLKWHRASHALSHCIDQQSLKRHYFQAQNDLQRLYSLCLNAGTPPRSFGRACAAEALSQPSGVNRATLHPFCLWQEAKHSIIDLKIILRFYFLKRNWCECCECIPLFGPYPRR